MEKDKDKMGFKDLFTDPKYRARMILVFYLMLFIAIVIWFRSLPRPNLNNTNENTNTNENADNNNDEGIQAFYLISSNNFSFEYILNIDDTKVISVGKKYMAKEKFESSNTTDSTIIEYYVDGTGVKGREKVTNATPNAYINMSKPYLYIDYFDTKLLEKIIMNAAKENDDTVLKINNSKLCSIVGCPTNMQEGINTVELEMKNNYIVAIKMDYSAFATALKPYYMTEEFSSASFELKYNDFNLIDEIDAKN